MLRCFVSVCALSLSTAAFADKADPPEPKTKPKKDTSTSDAMKVLEAANKDTTNTL